MIAVRELSRRFDGREVVADVSLSIAPGEWLSLMGPSGCGKTTLLQMIGLFDEPSSGRVLFEGEDAWSLPVAARADLRLARIGFVFQAHNLLPHLDARENVALPAWQLGGSRAAAFARADELLERFGLGERARQPARLLSGGEAQRVAIARALANRPALVLADEPTGNLDSAAAAAVLDTLAEVAADGALLVVTHEASVAARAGRTLGMRDGRLTE